jgi:hypothetical protein
MSETHVAPKVHTRSAAIMLVTPLSEAAWESSDLVCCMLRGTEYAGDRKLRRWKIVKFDCKLRNVESGTSCLREKLTHKVC